VKGVPIVHDQKTKNPSKSNIIANIPFRVLLIFCVEIIILMKEGEGKKTRMPHSTCRLSWLLYDGVVVSSAVIKSIPFYCGALESRKRGAVHLGIQ